MLTAVIADGDPLRDLHPLFDLPAHPDGASVSAVVAFPGAGAPGGVLVRAGAGRSGGNAAGLRWA